MFYVRSCPIFKILAWLFRPPYFCYLFCLCRRQSSPAAALPVSLLLLSYLFCLCRRQSSPAAALPVSLPLLLLSYLFCLCRRQSSPAAALPVSLSPSCPPLPVFSSHTIRHSNNKPLSIAKKALFGIGMFSKNLHSFVRGFKN